MDEVRLMMWFEGYLQDDELTDEEVAWLEEAVMDAAAFKLGATQVSMMVH